MLYIPVQPSHQVYLLVSNSLEQNILWFEVPVNHLCTVQESNTIDCEEEIGYTCLEIFQILRTITTIAVVSTDTDRWVWATVTHWTAKHPYLG